MSNLITFYMIGPNANFYALGNVRKAGFDIIDMYGVFGNF